VRSELVGDQLAELRRLVADISDPQQLAGAPDLAAFVAFAAGRLDDARTAWLRAAELWASSWAGSLATSLPRAARAALWAGDGAAARDDLAALAASGVHGPAIEADRRTVQAGIAALEGRPSDALALYREALRAWRDLGLAWDEALCGLDMALLLDPAEPEVRAATEAAREILVRLEAAPFLARLDDALARVDRDGSATTR
jgi:tetratricopeptide (TPR) repeat protein